VGGRVLYGLLRDLDATEGLKDLFLGEIVTKEAKRPESGLRFRGEELTLDHGLAILLFSTIAG
jgi:hypothetical protein